MAVNSLGLGSFEVEPEREGEFYGMKYAGLTPEEAAALNRPPPSPPIPPMPPRRLPEEVVATRLRDTEQALGRLERATSRGADCGLLIDEVRSNLQLLSGEYAGILRDIESGKIVPHANTPFDAGFFARVRKSRQLLIDLLVPDAEFLAAAKGVFEILRAHWPKQISSGASPASGES